MIFRIEPTGEGLIYRWSRQPAGNWSKTPYTTRQAEEALAVWQNYGIDRLPDQLLADMAAAIELERAQEARAPLSPLEASVSVALKGE